MNMELAALWAQVIFGGLAVLLFIAWFATGQKSAALRIGGALSLLICIAMLVYTNYIL